MQDMYLRDDVVAKRLHVVMPKATLRICRVRGKNESINNWMKGSTFTALEGSQVSEVLRQDASTSSYHVQDHLIPTKKTYSCWGIKLKE
jgi:hypothetical protein